MIEGKPFEQNVQERWVDPIGMKTATYFRPDSARFDVVTLYRDDGRWIAAAHRTTTNRIGGVRWIVRRVRHRTQTPAIAAPRWRTAAVLTGLLLTHLICLQTASGNLAAFGTVSPLSVGMVLAGVLFAEMALIGLLRAVRRRPTVSRWDRLSVGTARGALVLYDIVAAYAAVGRYIGWRPWV